MPTQVRAGAQMTCSFGTTPAVLIVTPENKTTAEFTPAATIMDYAPMKNIPTFGMCSSPANPTVASATAAAMGVLTPMPCIPATSAPWTPGSTAVMVNNKPALHDGCTCLCNWGGSVSITSPGCTGTEVS